VVRVNEAMIYEAFRRFLVRHLRPRDDAVHVGEVCGCLRKAYYNRKYGSLDLRHYAETKYVILGLGLSTHAVLEEVLREMGFETERQVERRLTLGEGNVTIAGTPDAFNGEAVIEIKTTKRIPERPYEHHLMQLNAYLWMLDCYRGYIVYIDKSKGYVKVFEHRFSEKLLGEFLRRAISLWKAIKYDIPPERERGPLCNYCDWRWMCYRGENP